jgi:hypothetical protein
MKKCCFTMEEMKAIERILKDELDFNIEFAIKMIESYRKIRKEQKNE